jgi:hypothetical protein
MVASLLQAFCGVAGNGKSRLNVEDSWKVDELF